MTSRCLINSLERILSPTPLQPLLAETESQFESAIGHPSLALQEVKRLEVGLSTSHTRCSGAVFLLEAWGRAIGYSWHHSVSSCGA